MLLFILALVAGPMLVTAFFVGEVVAGLVPRSRHSVLQRLPSRTTVVMPAHDEAAIIVATLNTLSPQLAGWAKLLVIADNCVDDTAALARGCGAEVIERADPERRGKGFALDFARNYLQHEPPDAVIVFDADCWSTAESLQLLVRSALTWHRPCQAIYLMAPAQSAPAMVELSNFAFLVKNLVRQRGLQRLAGRVHLVGTGMAFPWSVFEQAPLATANIVEDVELGLALKRASFPPQLVPEATVLSAPSSAEGTLVQRTRWEGGYLALVRAQAPRAISRAFRERSGRALVAAIDLCVPPLTLLAVIDATVLALAAISTAILGAPWWPVWLFLVVAVGAVAAIATAWVCEGRSTITARTLIRIPLYIAWKVPLYLGLAKHSPREWLRPGR